MFYNDPIQKKNLLTIVLVLFHPQNFAIQPRWFC